MEDEGDSENKGGGENACDPVRSQPEVTEVEFRRMGEEMEEMIVSVWFPTVAFGASWIHGWAESGSAAVLSFEKS